MDVRNIWLHRQLAVVLASLLAVPCGMAATSPRPSSPPSAKSAASSPSGAGAADTTASHDSASNNSYPDAPEPSLDSSNGQTTQAQQTQHTTGSGNQQTQSTQPVGTAAAPYLKPQGIAASRPAGAAIAPAKQRRVRSFAIRVALLVGAGVAIGTVIAASLGSPSRAN